MKSKEKASIATFLLKVLGISILLIFGITLAVKGDNLDIKSVKVVFDNGSSINIMTTKSTVSQILSENHILLLEDEITTPSLEDELGDSDKIVISKIDENSVQTVASVEEDIIDLDNLDDYYKTISGDTIIVTEEIPYQTIQKDISNDAADTTTKVLQEGVVGLRETKYRVKYEGDVEVEREEVYSRIIREPVNKIVQISAKPVVTSRAYVERDSVETSSTGNSLALSVANIEPKIITLNTSAYTASTCGKSSNDPGYGISASGQKAKSWYTVAAGKNYALGTVIYIPYFKDAPNGGWFVVQDRGGSISNSKLDIYMDSYDDCIAFGRKSLECYVYQF